jgi:hypothetical protein
MIANVGIQGALFNDTADGGFDGIAGDVRASLDLSVEANGTRRAQYCLQRSNDANAEDRTGLLADGEDCQSFPVRVEIDRAYRAAIALDPIASTITFRLDGFVKVVPINTDIFTSANPYCNASAPAQNLGKMVSYIDYLRTAPTALTPSETASSATAPPAFPAEPDPASLQVDSTLDDPFDFTQSLDFVDDFSTDTSQLGFWGGRVRGDSSVHYLNDSIELQTNSLNTDDGNFTEFWINGVTNSLRARVSLSSKSILPTDPNAEAEIGLSSIFHNDTQENGFDGEAGDINVSIRLRVRGDGRQSVSVGSRRRDAVGDQEDLRIIDGEAFWDFDGFVPELDTVYELGIQIDRERRVLIVSLDDNSREIQLPTEAFLPAVRRALVQVNHRGSSGRAVGSIHSINTDTVDLNFAVNPPLLGPYRPTFDARHPGRKIDVIDGRLRLEADGRLSSGFDPRIVALGASDFVGATVELSSASTFLPDGEIFIDVSGTLFNELADGGFNGSEGSVFATVRLVAIGAGERFVRYCAYRSTTSDFSDSIELITGDNDNCARFAFVPELDTMYPVSISLDRTAATLTFRLGDETHVYAITSDIFDPDGPFNGVRAHTSDGSVVIAYADDLASPRTQCRWLNQNHAWWSTTQDRIRVVVHPATAVGVPFRPGPGIHYSPGWLPVRWSVLYEGDANIADESPLQSRDSNPCLQDQASIKYWGFIVRRRMGV